MSGRWPAENVGPRMECAHLAATTLGVPWSGRTRLLEGVPSPGIDFARALGGNDDATILGFCRDWRSVAEISAVLRMPLGVARVLIADMAVEGLVRVHQLDHAQGRPDLNLLERVLSGLRKL